MIKWDSLSANKFSTVMLLAFASKLVSGRSFYSLHVNTENGGEARKLLRNHGVVYARRLARKALRRRGLDISVGV